MPPGDIKGQECPMDIRNVRVFSDGNKGESFPLGGGGGGSGWGRVLTWWQ